MPVTSGYGLTSLSETVNLNLNESQSRLQTDVSRLSSGLRINAAVDDPSGLAIAEGLQGQVNGYDQASSNVQTANNMLTVADGALQTVTNILQRLRDLAVEANDDLISVADRADIQAESTQLQAEINTISESTNFNGLSLLNRNPYSAPVPPTVQDNTFSTPSVVQITNSPGGTPWTFSTFVGGNAAAGIASVAYLKGFSAEPSPPSGATQVGRLLGGAPDTLLVPPQNPPTISQSIAGFKSDESYTISFNAIQASFNPGLGSQQSFAVLVDGTQIASYQPIPQDPANPDWTTITTPAFVPGAGAHTISFEGTGETVAYLDNIQLNVSSASISQGPTSNLQVQDGAAEGNALAVTLPTVFTSNLGIATNTVADSTSAATYEGNIDSAISYVVTARATLGAQMVRLQYQATNDDTGAVNLQASESNIRDINVAQETTALAQEQILTSAGTSVLANIKTQAALVEKLFQ